MMGLWLWAMLAVAFAGDAPFAGIPLTALPSLGLRDADLSEHEAGWQAPLDRGGFVRLRIAADTEAAAATFRFLRTSAVAVAPPDLDLPGADEAAGDGTGLVLARKGNVVMLVRDFGGDADGVATRLIGALVAEAPSGGVTREIDGVVVRWDACGRPLAD